MRYERDEIPKEAVPSGTASWLAVVIPKLLQARYRAVWQSRLSNAINPYIVNATRFAVVPPSRPCHSAKSNASLI